MIKPSLAKPVRTSVTSCRYSYDGKLIAAGLSDGSIQLWGVTGGLGAGQEGGSLWGIAGGVGAGRLLSFEGACLEGVAWIGNTSGLKELCGSFWHIENALRLISIP